MECDGERQALNSLNSRFELYLKRIQDLVKENQNLQEQIEDFHVKSKENSTTTSSSSLKQFRHLCEQINEEVEENLRIETRTQRAEYDRKSFGNYLKNSLIDEQDEKDHRLKCEYEFESKHSELKQLEKHYETREKDLQNFKRQYDEALKTLIDCKTQYESIVAERTQIDQTISNLQNEILLERAYHRRRKDEWKWIETISAECHRKIDHNETDLMLKRIRDDYRKFNELQLEQSEISYRMKLDLLQKQLDDEFEQIDEVDEFIEENFILEQQIQQMENELHQLTEHQRTELNCLNDEFDRIEANFPDVESLIIAQRHNNVHLSSEIHTYRSLLVNHSSFTETHSNLSLQETIYRIENRTGFKIRRNSQLIWVRI